MITKDSYNNEISMEDIEDIISLKDIASCKRYMHLMLDFYFDAIEYSRECSSPMQLDANIWLQTIFTKACAFFNLLDGINYAKSGVELKTVLDPSLLFTIARRIYESVVDFNILYIQPHTLQQKEILYNLFISAGLSERLKNWDESLRTKYPERTRQEEKDIQNCRDAIENNALWTSLSKETQQIIRNALNFRKFRYKFNSANELTLIKWENAYAILKIRKDLYESMYSFFSLHSHPSYLALIQFRDAFASNVRQDVQMAIYATRCILSFMSIFIVDYMATFPKVRDKFNELGLPVRFAIGMYEDIMRGESKYK